MGSKCSQQKETMNICPLGPTTILPSPGTFLTLTTNRSAELGIANNTPLSHLHGAETSSAPSVPIIRGDTHSPSHCGAISTPHCHKQMRRCDGPQLPVWWHVQSTIELSAKTSLPCARRRICRIAYQIRQCVSEDVCLTRIWVSLVRLGSRMRFGPYRWPPM